METKKMSIEIDQNTASDLADIICWFRGYLEAKGESWEQSWLSNSLDSLSKINKQIKNGN